MLEDIKKSYETYAKLLPGWEKMNKNTLVNLYIENEHNEDSEIYFAAIMCRYWYNIGKYYNQSRNSVSIEECYDWLVHAITYALKHRKWLDPQSSMYNDPAGPDKVINRCIASTRQIFYQASNTDKRKVNFQLESIEKHEDTYGENMRSRIDLNAIPTYNSEKDAISAAKIEEIVRYFTNNDMPFAGVLVDAIAYQDTFKEKKISALVSTFDLNKKKLTDFVNNIDTSFAEYYSKKYKVKKEIIENLALNLKKSNSNRLNKLIQKTMYELKHNEFVKENLCY